MIYQVIATILFKEEDEARDFYHDCELALVKGTFINPNSENLEMSSIQLLVSNHELNPNEPSILLLRNSTLSPF